MRIEIMLFSVLIVLMTSTSSTDYSGFIDIWSAAKPEVCRTLYEPVLGIPTLRTHANACVAYAEGAWVWIKWILS